MISPGGYSWPKLKFWKKMDNDGQAPGEDASRKASSRLSSSNSRAVREDSAQMAVKFLSHLSVRVSPIDSRRFFLERKGLTNEEIEEAFHRVPDPSSSRWADAQTYCSLRSRDDCICQELVSLEAMVKQLELQTIELISMHNSIHKLEGAKKASLPFYSNRNPITWSGHMNDELAVSRPPLPPASTGSSVGQHRRAAPWEIMAELQQAEKRAGKVSLRKPSCPVQYVTYFISVNHNKYHPSALDRF